MSNITVVPWGLHPLSPWVIDELKRRAREYGQNLKSNGRVSIQRSKNCSGLDFFQTEYQNYLPPKARMDLYWRSIRICRKLRGLIKMEK
jgi:hypothetical protein